MAEHEIHRARCTLPRRGRLPLPPALRRDRLIRARFTLGQAEEIRELAEHWKVPAAVAVWAIVTSQLARWRRVAPRYGRHGLAIAGALRVLRQRWAEERAAAESESSDAE